MRQGTLAGILVVAALLGGAASAHAQAGVSYRVPDDNPFVGQAGAAPEIWAYGLRNPWRFSFDRATGDMNIADVGQDAVEEVNFAPAGRGGSNYGWNCFEGTPAFEGAPDGCTAPGHVPPVFEYSSESDTVACSITGGYVVRDESLPIAGRYIYGDFCTGELRSVQISAAGSGDDSSLNIRVPAVSTFGEDSSGRLYAASLAGPVFRLVAGGGPLPVVTQPIGVFNTPVYVTSPPDDADSLFVVEQGGTIQLARSGAAPTTFLDISDLTATSGPLGERGLVSMAFAPDYATSGLFYVYFTDPDGDIHIEEFKRSASDPDTADPATRRTLLTQEHSEFANHNAGQLQFGPDGYLYAALGDGGSGGDPHRNAQNLGVLLGKIIRIDPTP